jgi:3-dehydroquinate synthase
MGFMTVSLDVTSARGNYQAKVGPGILDRFGEVLEEEGLRTPRSVVTDTTVGPLHGRKLADALGLDLLELPGGETNKTSTTVEAVCRHWLGEGLDRGGSVLAVGGGIVTDTIGFAAAVYLRGIDWIAAPTTLLGMVDAAIGGKTGVNLTEGKNLVGAFWPPRLVVADTGTLATLPERELRAGLAEVVKSAWISDHTLLDAIPGVKENTYGTVPAGAWETLVARTVAIKAGIVAADEREAGRRKALNLGHTIGHALEAATGYERFLHGEAVAWGLEAAALLGRRRGLLSAAGERALRAAVSRLGERPAIADLEAERVCSFIAVDKKRDAAGVAWVLPTDDGVVLDQRVDTAEAVEVLRELQRA